MGKKAMKVMKKPPAMKAMQKIRVTVISKQGNE